MISERVDMATIQNHSSELIQCLTLGVATTLEKRPGISDVKLSDYEAAERNALIGWEQKNCCVMPSDLKNFYQTTNGLLLTWKVANFNNPQSQLAIGRMEINPVADLRKISSPSSTESILNKISLADADYHTDSEDDEDDSASSSKTPHFDSRSKLFEIDGCGGMGKVCLVYPQASSSPRSEFWFVDRALQWWFIAADFTTYFRLMLMHLGLPHWQYAFTSIGLPQKSKQWFNLYAPVRLQLNEQNNLEKSSSTTSNDEIAVSPVKVDFSRVFRGKLAAEKKQQKSSNNQATTSKRKSLQNLSSRSVPSLRSNRSSKPWT